MAPTLVLIVSPEREWNDRIAEALSSFEGTAFTFANTGEEALDSALSVEPDAAIVRLPIVSTARLCRALRALSETRRTRVLVVVDPEDVGALRNVVVSGIIVAPASSTMVAFELRRVIARIERRADRDADRRAAFRGGRRVTDVLAN